MNLKNYFHNRWFWSILIHVAFLWLSMNTQRISLCTFRLLYPACRRAANVESPVLSKASLSPFHPTVYIEIFIRCLLISFFSFEASFNKHHFKKCKIFSKEKLKIIFEMFTFWVIHRHRCIVVIGVFPRVPKTHECMTFSWPTSKV